MKGQKLLSLDTEVIQELKGLDNASGFINQILVEYFNDADDMQIDKLRAKIDANNREIAVINDKNKALEDKITIVLRKDAELKNLYGAIPEQIMKNIRNNKHHTTESLMKQYNSQWKRDYNVSFELIKQAYMRYNQFTDLDTPERIKIMESFQ